MTVKNESGAQAAREYGASIESVGRHDNPASPETPASAAPPRGDAERSRGLHKASATGQSDAAPPDASRMTGTANGSWQGVQKAGPDDWLDPHKAPGTPPGDALGATSDGPERERR